MSEKGFVLLMEAIMEQAYKDAEASDKALAEEATAYIEMMKEAFGN